MLRSTDVARRSTQWNALPLLILIACALPACRGRDLAQVEHPETGYAFPHVSEIANIDFQGAGWSDLPDFPVPRGSWGALLNALSPSQRDDDVPTTWTVLEVVRIVTTSGNEHWVSLYLVGDPKAVGAFSAGPSEASYDDFRGGNSKILTQVVRDAYALYLRDQKSDAEEKR